MSNCNNSDDILAKHKDLSTKLNIEEFYINRSWNSFKEMSEMYTLDVSITCILYMFNKCYNDMLILSCAYYFREILFIG